MSLGDYEPPLKRPKLLSESLMCPQHPLTEKDGFVEVQQKQMAGFSSDTCLLFIRKETVDLWSALDSAIGKGLNISVDGPPGTGKSTEAWAWSLYTAVNKQTKVTWFHFSKNRAHLGPASVNRLG